MRIENQVLSSKATSSFAISTDRADDSPIPRTTGLVKMFEPMNIRVDTWNSNKDAREEPIKVEVKTKHQMPSARSLTQFLTSKK
jgi:hypothetical protein